MRVLIAEDDTNSRFILQRFIEPYAACEVAQDGEEAFEEFCDAQERGEPYDIIFLDIMMPRMDGQSTLTMIRDWEVAHGIIASSGVKVIMTTALDDEENIFDAHVSGCFNYLVKPLSRQKVVDQLKQLGCVE